MRMKEISKRLAGVLHGEGQDFWAKSFYVIVEKETNKPIGGLAGAVKYETEQEARDDCRDIKDDHYPAKMTILYCVSPLTPL